MAERALGLVETRGLVAALEAADAMLKVAPVVCAGREVTDAALVTIKVVGEVAAVRAAVAAGGRAAARVGELVATHVIPRPQVEAEVLIYDRRERARAEASHAAHDVTGLSAVPLDRLSVSELRNIARRIPGFPLSPSQISRASKRRLLEKIRKAMPNSSSPAP